MRAKKRLIVAFILAFAFNLNAQSTFTSNENDGRNQATFTSDAPLENIVGVSNNVGVMVMLDTDDVTNSPKGKVKVDLKTLKTGIDLRDEHLRSENWLHTEKYQYAEFMLTGITKTSSKSISNGENVNVTLAGKMTIHGVTKDITAPAILTYYKESEKTRSKIKGNLLKVKSNFSIKLSDYGVNIPNMVVGKVDENIQLSINFISTDASGKLADNPCGCNPCGMKKEGKCNPCGMKEGKCNPCKMKGGKCNPCKSK
jgi:polyisoprenoid-binding protein YceI